MDFLNKSALIIGGSSGIGLAAAKEFIKEGGRAVVTGRSVESASKAEALLGKDKADAFAWDISKDMAAPAFLAQNFQKRGIDFLFANAGVFESNQMGRTTEAQYRKVFDVNVRGIFFAVQAALPFMRRGGAMVLSCSQAASSWIPRASLYSASKAAIRSFAASWSFELKPRKIRVNSISFGVIKTEGAQKALKERGASEKTLNAYLRRATAAERAGTVEEAARAVLFIAQSKYINGADIPFDGGWRLPRAQL